MLQKTFTPKRTVCKVTFSIPREWAKEKVHVVGDFNEWDQTADKLEKNKDNWEVTLRLKPENKYRFRYLLDGVKWENDDAADDYVPNEFGTEDSVVEIGN